MPCLKFTILINTLSIYSPSKFESINSIPPSLYFLHTRVWRNIYSIGLYFACMAKRPRLWRRRRRLGVGWEEHSSSGRKLYHTWAGRYIFSLFFFFVYFILPPSLRAESIIKRKKMQQHNDTRKQSRLVARSSNLVWGPPVLAQFVFSLFFFHLLLLLIFKREGEKINK